MTNKFKDLLGKMAPARRAGVGARVKSTPGEMRPTEEFGTGLVCPACKQSAGTIEAYQPDVIAFRCQACKHRWSADKSGTRVN